MRLVQQADLPRVERDGNADQIRTLRQTFERLFQTDHPLRKNLFFLDNMELIRIIEGKQQ